MKKLMILITMLLLTGILAACGDSDEVTEQPQNNDPAPSEDASEDQNDAVLDEDTGEDSTPGDATENTDRTDDNNNSGLNTDYIFTSFDLEVDIENNDDAVDVDYDEDRDDNETEASYEHKPQELNLKGNEALNVLDGIFTSFQFDENTPNDEVINEVLEAFNIPENAAKVDLEIEFANGTEKEYNR